jgi:hypothetical protein
MSYRSVLGRGYSVTRGPEGGILRSAAQAGLGDWIETELVDGKVDSQVGAKGTAHPEDEPKPKSVDLPMKTSKTRERSRKPVDGEPTLF